MAGRERKWGHLTPSTNFSGFFVPATERERRREEKEKRENGQRLRLRIRSSQSEWGKVERVFLLNQLLHRLGVLVELRQKREKGKKEVLRNPSDIGFLKLRVDGRRKLEAVIDPKV